MATQLNSGTETGVIPFALVRFGDFGISGSTLLRKSFNMSDGGASIFSLSRREWDVNALYYFLPSVSASIGWKETSWRPEKKSGPVAAISASTAISGPLGAYITFGVGRLETKSDGQTYNGTYVLSDSGFSYSLPAVGNVNSALTLGYRHQRIRTRDIPLGSVGRFTVVDQTSGLTLGLVASF